jgi:hypothetical protein
MRIVPALVFQAVFTVLLVFSGCSTLMEKAGQVLDGSAFAEKTEAAYENSEAGFSGGGVRVSRNRVTAQDREYILIEFAAFPTLGIRASVPDRNHRIVLESLEFFSPNRDGWNVFSREISGEGRFKDEWYTAFLVIPQAPEVLDIAAGRILRGGVRITGDEALTALRNREERIAALVTWMASRLEGEGSPSGFKDEGAFADFWEPILFPEMVPAKKRPPEWAAPEWAAPEWTAGGGRGGRWQRGEDIAWSVDYTEALFPPETAENLRPVRNSGTLLRDWEEALPWIFYQFEWDAIIASLSSEIRLVKVK